MASRDAEIRAVVTQLDDILDALRVNVDVLAAILAAPADGCDHDGRGGQ